jgi:hypothetical protein
MIESRSIAVHGLTATISCSERQIIEWFEFDFRYFLVQAPQAEPDVRLTVELIAPPFETMPPMEEVMHSRQFACFEQGAKRYINYQNRTLLVFDYANHSGVIYCADHATAYEKLYLTLLSRLGEKLDYMGLHRVHALGIAYESQACLFLIPEGGGKSTLALSLLDSPKVKLFSEDTPFIDKHAHVFPFPFRLGICDGSGTELIPERYKREVLTQYGVHKTLVESSYFADKTVKEPMLIGILFCGKWVTSQSPRIVKTSRLTAFGYLVRDCIFGLGLPQVIELFLTSGINNLLKKSSIALSRTVASLSLLTRSRCYQLYLSNSPEENAKLIVSFLESHKVSDRLSNPQSSVAS